MTAKRILVFDESGTSSTPGDHRNAHEFACCGLLLDRANLGSLRRLHEELAQATKNSDFKFGDVRKSPKASALFMRGMSSSPCDIFAFYGPPGSVAAEQDRFEALYEEQFGPPPHGTEEPARRTHRENLLQFVRLVLGTILARPFERHTVFWDARTDKDAIERGWSEATVELRVFGIVPADREIPQLVVGPPNDLKFLARLAGVVAGDIVAFFRNCGDRVYQLTRPKFVVPRNPAQLTGHLKVADGKGHLIRPGVDDTGPKGTLLRGYYRRFVNRHVFFYDPRGRACGVRLLSNHSWEVLQVPDRV